MGNYQGPNAQVTQQFVATPGAVAVESLPSVAVASAFNVFSKEPLANARGIIDQLIPWGVDKVIYDESVAGARAYNMYPPAAFANSRFGYMDLGISSSDMSNSGITLSRDKTFAIPNTTKAAGTCQALIPYYTISGTAGTIIIQETSKDTVQIAGGAVATAKIKPGMSVFIRIGGTWTLVGSVGSVGPDETKFKLATPYSAAVTNGTDLVVGAASSTTLDYPNILWDPTADFVLNKVAPGDILKMSSLSIPGSTEVGQEIMASIITVIDKNTIKFNTVSPEAGQVDYDITKYKTSTIVPGNTIQVYTYSIQRLVGFSENYGLKLLGGGSLPTFTGIAIDNVNTNQTQFTIGPVSGLPALAKGDQFIITAANIAAASDERAHNGGDLKIYTVDTITVGAGIYTITCVESMKNSDSGHAVIADGNFIHAWVPIINSEVDVDFRSVRSEEHNIVKRIGSIKDIFDAWVRPGEESIDPRNELAFMMNIIFARSGGKVCYGVNIDATSDNLSAEYAAALEELKLVDVYSHSFGTTDPGVNAIVGAYCDEQSAPYEAHERTGVICYDLDDLFLMGSDVGGISIAGLITLTGGSLNLQTAGVTVNDRVNMFDSDGDLVAQATIVSSPTTSAIVQTDYEGSSEEAATIVSFRFESGRKDDQAVRAGSIKYVNRRVSMLFPGWFYADFNGTRMLLPPYFIAAAIVGMDSGIIVSQSFTNMPFSIPGLSNIQLDTNTYYRKAQLDEIGGGGVDILIQDATITQSIKSRHDLTTNMDAVQYRERSITKQADVAAKTIRAAVSPYVGRYNINDPNLFRFLGQVCSIVCAKLVKDGILAKLSVTRIVRDEVIDDKINFFMEATVFIAGNYYDITLLVKSR